MQTSEGAARRRRLWVALVLSLSVAIGVPVAWAATRADESVGVRPAFDEAGSETSETPSASPSESATPTPTPRPPTPSPTAESAPIEPVAAPVRLEVPAIGVSAAVIPTGVADDGAAEVPRDVDTVGWYRFGPAPGATAGSAVLIGHVDSRSQGLGALAAMRDVQPGAVVDVVAADGRTTSYEVIARESIDKDVVPLDTLFARDGAPRLTIITCTGAFDESVQHYTDNLVVTAVPRAAA